MTNDNSNDMYVVVKGNLEVLASFPSKEEALKCRDSKYPNAAVAPRSVVDRILKSNSQGSTFR